jgi:hypothetical protein
LRSTSIDDREIQAFARVDRGEAHGVVLGGEDGGLGLVGLVADAAIEPADEAGERASATAGDADEAIEVADARLGAREGREDAVEIEGGEGRADRLTGREAERGAAQLGEARAKGLEPSPLARIEEAWIDEAIERVGRSRAGPAREQRDGEAFVGQGEARERGVGEAHHRAAEHGGEGEAIARIEEQAQERGDVAHLGGVVERAAGDDVGDREAAQRELDQRDGAPAPREHGAVAVAHGLAALCAPRRCAR